MRHLHLRRGVSEGLRAFGAQPGSWVPALDPKASRAFQQLIAEAIHTGNHAWDEAERKLQELYEVWLVKLPRDLTREILFVVEPA